MMHIILSKYSIDVTIFCFLWTPFHSYFSTLQATIFDVPRTNDYQFEKKNGGMG